MDNISLVDGCDGIEKLVFYSHIVFKNDDDPKNSPAVCLNWLFLPNWKALNSKNNLFFYVEIQPMSW